MFNLSAWANCHIVLIPLVLLIVAEILYQVFLHATLTNWDGRNNKITDPTKFRWMLNPLCNIELRSRREDRWGDVEYGYENDDSWSFCWMGIPFLFGIVMAWVVFCLNFIVPFGITLFCIVIGVAWSVTYRISNLKADIEAKIKEPKGPEEE